MNKYIWILLCALAWSTTDARSFYMSDVRNLSMGGSMDVVQMSSAMAAANPALQARNGFKLYLPSIQFHVSDNTLSTFQFINDHVDQFSNVETMTDEELDEFYWDLDEVDDKFVNVVLKTGVGLYLKGFGLFAEINSDAAVKVDRGIYTPAVAMKGAALSAVTLSYGQMIGDIQSVGASVRILMGKELRQTRFNASDMANSGDAITKLNDALGDSTLDTGYSVNLGYWRQLPWDLDLGVSVRDLLGSFSDETYLPDLVAGVGGSWKYGVHWYASMNDMLNLGGTHLLSRLHLGGELDLPVIKPRIGLNQGYPTVGLGLNFKILSLNYAWYGEELGRKPGMYPGYSHALQLLIGWE